MKWNGNKNSAEFILRCFALFVIFDRIIFSESVVVMIQLLDSTSLYISINSAADLSQENFLIC